MMSEVQNSFINKKSLANQKGNAQQQCMFERPVKQNLCFYYSRQRAPDDRRLIIYSVYVYSPESVICLALPTPYRLEIANFPYPLSFSAIDRGDLLLIYGKALRFLKLESSLQPMLKIW